jgi:thioredoxin-like negative regulator of GroEL
VNSHARLADPAALAAGADLGEASKPKPTLVFFYAPTSGGSRRAEGFLAQVLQRRRNHDTFTLQRVNYEARPELAARLGVESAPAIVVIEARRVRARLERPRGCADLQAALAPWLR